jgi:phosphoenolpyruvate carboxylase
MDSEQELRKDVPSAYRDSHSSWLILGLALSFLWLVTISLPAMAAEVAGQTRALKTECGVRSDASSSQLRDKTLQLENQRSAVLQQRHQVYSQLSNIAMQRANIDKKRAEIANARSKTRDFGPVISELTAADARLLKVAGTLDEELKFIRACSAALVK